LYVGLVSMTKRKAHGVCYDDRRRSSCLRL
jgi:hypothetical protein